MTFKELLKKYKGQFVANKVTGNVPIKDTAYGAIIERFELDKYDINITCLGLEQLERLLEKLTKDVHNQ